MISPHSPGSSGHPEPFEVSHCDVVIVGSGVAGLSAALELSRVTPDARVVLLTRERIGAHGASPLAQGGIAAALDPSDSPSLHARDTELAANGLARRELVDILTEEGPERVRNLMDLGARFDRDPSGELALGLEGAHSRHRIVHADGDRTGAEVTRTLSQAVRRAPGVRTLEDARALELFVSEGGVRGVWIRSFDGALRLVRASETVLATGGPGRVYLRTTAPAGLDGDGLAMAARAGATLRDLEFVQFHPTALDVAADPLPLVTEALRGAGATLIDRAGRRILAESDGGELASRDRVARALWLRIQEGRRAFLDARNVFAARDTSVFPGVRHVCRMHGLDPALHPIPVTPAAHYHMGGVAVDADGRTSLDGLWAIGEAAASGVHGANRLASNSLLEGMVFGPRAAHSIAADLDGDAGLSTNELALARRGALELEPRSALSDEVVQRIRGLMWRSVGVVRSEHGLSDAARQLDELALELHRTVPGPGRNLLLSARMIARAALMRTESVGSHYRADAPDSQALRPRHSLVRLTGTEPAGIHVEHESEWGASSAPLLRSPQTADARPREKRSATTTK